jgi:hypothetical protein
VATKFSKKGRHITKIGRTKEIEGPAEKTGALTVDLVDV